MTRAHDVGQLTMAEHEIARRQLRANLGLITPGSPAHAPILAQMRASMPSLPDVPVAGRPARASVPAARCFPADPLPSARRAGTSRRTSVRPARALTPNGTRAEVAADCDLKNLYQEAAALSIDLSAVRATVAGLAGHCVMAVAVRPGTGRNAAERTTTSLAISPGLSRPSPRAACPV